jgi:hypothetical protein
MTMFDQQWIGSTGKSLGPLKKGGQGSIHATSKEFGWEGIIYLVCPMRCTFRTYANTSLKLELRFNYRGKIYSNQETSKIP